MAKILPHFIKPQLATLVEKPLDDDHWIHEIKFDGYRMLCFLNDNAIRLVTRNGNDWSHKFPGLMKSLRTFPKMNSILDGEVVVLDKKGLSHFQLLQNAFDEKNTDIATYFIFDILYYNGMKLMNFSLTERKKILSDAFKLWRRTHRNIVLTQYIIGQGSKIYRQACKNGLEGIVSKEIESLYEPKRTRTWQKSKCIHRQEFVIGGFTDPKGNRKFFGALVLGYYNRDKLIYCGRVGTGFSEKTLHQLFDKMHKIVSPHSHFFNTQDIGGKSEINWIKPKLAAEVSFTEWTDDGALRHPSFLGLRLDKKIKEIRREV